MKEIYSSRWEKTIICAWYGFIAEVVVYALYLVTVFSESLSLLSR